MSAATNLRPLLAPQIEARRVQLLQLQAQIQTLERAAELDASSASPDVLLALYLGLGGAKAAAKHCNAQGWHLPGVKGPRCWAPDDVYELVRGAAQPADAGLRAMARARLQGPPRTSFPDWR
jgi:hypothetical protein